MYHNQNMNYKFAFYLFMRRYGNYLFQNYKSATIFTEKDNDDLHQYHKHHVLRQNMFIYSKNMTPFYYMNIK